MLGNFFVETINNSEQGSSEQKPNNLSEDAFIQSGEVVMLIKFNSGVVYERFFGIIREQ